MGLSNRTGTQIEITPASKRSLPAEKREKKTANSEHISCPDTEFHKCLTAFRRRASDENAIGLNTVKVGAAPEPFWSGSAFQYCNLGLYFTNIGPDEPSSCN